MVRTIILLCLTTAFFLSPGCDPKKDAMPPQDQDFSCIKIFDSNGLGLGLHGGCTTSNDWGKITLSASEQEFLNFTDTVSLAGTTASNIDYFYVYPCPVTIGHPISFVMDGELDHKYKLKFAIVDESLNVVKQLAIKVPHGNSLQLLIDPAQFETGKYYRMYYRISADGAPSLFEGYGNFLVCKTHINGVTTTIESDCM
ncbi:MAG: hypothetical protein ACKVT2_01980 [Saprospiraceae bacterium]